MVSSIHRGPLTNPAQEKLIARLEDDVCSEIIGGVDVGIGDLLAQCEVVGDVEMWSNHLLDL